MRTDNKTFLQFHDISMTSTKAVSTIINVEIKLFGKF
jgi:hypothetical protein